jgi:hypothetical protein
MFVFALMAAPWISVLSIKYHKLTFSTTAAIAHAVVGPPDVDRYHPFGRTFHQPEPGRLTSWEDPSLMKYKYWSPFANKDYAMHQLKLIARNFQTIVRLLCGFDVIGIGLLAILGCLAVPSPWRENLLLQRCRWAIVPVVCLSGIYLPVYIQKVDGRYFYAAYPFLWVAVVGATDQLTARISRDWLRKAIVALALISFAVPPAFRAAVSPAAPWTRAAARRAHRAVPDRPIRVEQLEIDLALREIHSAQTHPYRITELPTPAGTLTHQAHAAVLELPVIAGDGGNMHQPVDRHLLQLHE